MGRKKRCRGPFLDLSTISRAKKKVEKNAKSKFHQVGTKNEAIITIFLSDSRSPVEVTP